MSKLLTNYCSCVFQVKGKEGSKGNSKSSFPYAVCAKSVYQGRGKRGPGAMACRFTSKILASYDVATLRGWLIFEGIVSPSKAAKLSKQEAAEMIHTYLKHKEPLRRIKVAKVAKRQASPQAVWRAKGQGRKKSPKAKLRAQ